MGEAFEKGLGVFALALPGVGDFARTEQGVGHFSWGLVLAVEDVVHGGVVVRLCNVQVLNSQVLNLPRIIRSRQDFLAEKKSQQFASFPGKCIHPFPVEKITKNNCLCGSFNAPVANGDIFFLFRLKPLVPFLIPVPLFFTESFLNIVAKF